MAYELIPMLLMYTAVVFTDPYVPHVLADQSVTTFQGLDAVNKQFISEINDIDCAVIGPEPIDLDVSISQVIDNELFKACSEAAYVQTTSGQQCIALLKTTKLYFPLYTGTTVMNSWEQASINRRQKLAIRLTKHAAGNYRDIQKLMNKISLRLHCIFTLYMNQYNNDGAVTASKINLIDLAGSERVAKTDVIGQRMEELKKINKSLSALGDSKATVERELHSQIDKLKNQLDQLQSYLENTQLELRRVKMEHKDKVTEMRDTYVKMKQYLASMGLSSVDEAKNSTMAPKLTNISVGAYGSGSMISLSNEGDIIAKHAIIKLGVTNTFVNDGSGGLSNDSNMSMNIAEIVGIQHKKINEQLIGDLNSMIFDEHNVLTLSMTEYGTIYFQYDKSDSNIQAIQQEITDLFENTKYGKKVKFLRPNDPQLSKLKSGGSNGDQIEKLKITIESVNPTNNNIIFVSKERVRAIFQFINQASINRYYWTQEAPLTALLCQNKSRPTTHGITSILSPILTVSSTKINTQSLAFTTYTNNGKTSDNIIVIDGYIDSPKTAAWNIMQASFSFFIRFCFWIYELKYYWFQLIIVINAIIMMTRWNLFRTSEITLLVFISLLSVSGSGSVTVTCTQRISTGVTSGSNFLKQACNVGELLVSCGIKPTVAGVNGYIRGTLVISEECWVKTHTYGAGQARAVAQCCTFSDTLPSCSLDNGGIVIGDNSVSTVQCGTGATFLHPLMFSCGGQSASAAVDGMYPNTIQPDTLEFWKYDCNHDLTNPQTCTFRTGNGPSYDQGGAIASCCASTYPINCVVRYGQPGFPFSNVSCPDGYFITTCNAWSNTVNIAGYFIEGNVCNAQSRGDSNQNIYSSAICCTTGVIDSDDFCKPPTTDPSISPTQAPSIAPSIVPTQPPSIAPTQPPSISPTQPPSIAPSISPTQLPSIAPSFTPSFTTDPTNNPTPNPTDNPTPNPTVSPWPKEAVSDDEESNSGSRSNSGSFDDAYVLGALLSERQHDNNGANKDEESNSGSFDDAYVSGALISERKHGNNGANKNEESNSGSRSNSGSFDDAYVSGALISERQHDNNGANKNEQIKLILMFHWNNNQLLMFVSLIILFIVLTVILILWFCVYKTKMNQPLQSCHDHQDQLSSNNV